MLSLKISLKRMLKDPLRIILTILQLAIGVALIIIILSFIYNILDSVDTDKGTIYQAIFTIDRRQKPVFTSEMINYLKHSKDIKGVAVIEVVYSTFLEYNDLTYACNKILGTDEDFFKILNLKLQDGYFFNSADVRGGTNVVVISDVVNKQLFGNDSGVGSTITIKNQRGDYKTLEIIGVYFADSVELDPGNEVHIISPYSIFVGSNKKHSIIWIAGNNYIKEMIKEELQLMLTDESIYYINHIDYSGLDLRNLRERDLVLSKSFVEGTLNFVGPYALIAIVATFTGVLSLMLMNVMGRSKEIGQMRALGGTKLDIVGQIIFESFLISLFGGLLGILFAFFTTRLIIEKIFLIRLPATNYFAMSTGVSHKSVVIALGGTIIIGLIASIYPAIRAVQISPIDAIRD